METHFGSLKINPMGGRRWLLSNAAEFGLLIALSKNSLFNLTFSWDESIYQVGSAGPSGKFERPVGSAVLAKACMRLCCRLEATPCSCVHLVSPPLATLSHLSSNFSSQSGFSSATPPTSHNSILTDLLTLLLPSCAPQEGKSGVHPIP